MYIPDTSAIINGIVSELIRNNKIKESIFIHKAVIAELEHQANSNKPIGFLGLEEIKKIRELCEEKDIKFEVVGNRPNPSQIQYAKKGEIDALIIDYAWSEGLTLITSDRVQALSAKSQGVNVIFVEKRKRKKLFFEEFFDEKTMSIHLKQDVPPFAKRGVPGKWSFVKIGEKPMNEKELDEIIREILENIRFEENSFIEIERPGSIIAQYKNYRIVITKPPLSDGIEITIVRPLKSLEIKDYNLPEKLLKRFEEKAEGILISGSPGAGKSTFASALARFYQRKGKIVKTIEAPRDLVLPPEITQFSKQIATHEEMRDILLLSRPDYTIFDEIRNPADFELFSDLRLAGVGMVGVLHATSPIDSIQRFIGKIELGMIPSIIDTVIFIENGNVKKVYELEMKVKIPSGLTEKDLSRPVVEVRDFISGELEYEIYKFGEETVVVPVKKSMKNYFNWVEREIKKYAKSANIEIKEGEIIVFVDRKDLNKIIGKKGRRVRRLEKKLGKPIRVEVK